VGLWLVVTGQFKHASATPALTLTWAEQVAGWVAEPFSTIIYGVVSEARHALQLVLEVLGLAVVLVAVAAVRHWRRPPAQRSAAASLHLALAGATLAMVVTALTIASVQSILSVPTLHYRSLMSVMPVLYLGLGVAFTVPFGRFAPGVGVALAAALSIVALQIPAPSLYGPQDQWREAAAIVRDQEQAGLPARRIAVLEVHNSRQDWTVELNNAYHRPAPNQDLPPELYGLAWIRQPADLAALPANQQLLLVAFHYWMPDLHAQLLTTAKDHFGPCHEMSVIGITILRCTPGPGR